MWGRGPPGETNSVIVEENKQGMRMRGDETKRANSEQSQSEFLNPAEGKVARGGHDA